MKKIISLILVLTLILSAFTLAGCSGDGQADENAITVCVVVSFFVSVSVTVYSMVTVPATVIVHCAVCPFAVVAVMTAEPSPTASTNPPDTVATLELLEVHVMVLSELISGSTPAERLRNSPTFIDAAEAMEVFAKSCCVSVW